jgi:hypothetical protein
VAVLDHGSDPLFFVLLFGVPVLFLICACLIIRWWMAKAAGAPESESAVRIVKRRMEAAFAAVRRARRRGRLRRVELAAMKAARGDELLSPEGVRAAAEALFRLVHLALSARDPGRLATLLGPELLTRVERHPSTRNAVTGPHEVVGDVLVEYVGFTTGKRPDEDRVVVLSEAVLRHGTEGRSALQIDHGPRPVCQHWTLGIRDGTFIVLDIEERTDGEHHLQEPIGAGQPQRPLDRNSPPLRRFSALCPSALGASLRMA